MMDIKRQQQPTWAIKPGELKVVQKTNLMPIEPSYQVRIDVEKNWMSAIIIFRHLNNTFR